MPKGEDAGVKVEGRGVKRCSARGRAIHVSAAILLICCGILASAFLLYGG